MRNRLFMTAAIGLCAVCAAGALALAACNHGGTNPTPGETSAYEQLERLTAEEHDLVTLTVSTTLGDVTLTGVYTMMRSEEGIAVEYTYEQMDPIIENADGSFTLPGAVKSTHHGNGIVTADGFETLEGEEIDISVAGLSLQGMNFAAENFENVNGLLTGAFTADVKDPAAFLGTPITCSGMKTEIMFPDGVLKTVKISYVSAENANVVLSYAFA